MSVLPVVKMIEVSSWFHSFSEASGCETCSNTFFILLEICCQYGFQWKIDTHAFFALENNRLLLQ